MELYNFFTEMVSEDRLPELESALIELKEYCHHVNIVKWPTNEFSNVSQRYSIIGQLYGEDTSIGDTDLMTDLLGIKYTWFDAFCPSINNI